MNVMDELAPLEQRAVAAVQIEDRKKRHEEGFRLEYICRRIDNQYRVIGGLNREAEVSLRAVIRIIFDYILHDKLDDDDWAEAFSKENQVDTAQVLEEVKKDAAS